MQALASAGFTAWLGTLDSCGMAEERAPDGFARVEDVFAKGELEAIAAKYEAVAGFSKEAALARTERLRQPSPDEIDDPPEGLGRADPLRIAGHRNVFHPRNGEQFARHAGLAQPRVEA